MLLRWGSRTRFRRRTIPGSVVTPSQSRNLSSPTNVLRILRTEKRPDSSELSVNWIRPRVLNYSSARQFGAFHIACIFLSYTIDYTGSCATRLDFFYSPVHTNMFSFENASTFMRFHLSYTWERYKFIVFCGRVYTRHIYVSVSRKHGMWKRNCLTLWNAIVWKV